jgi:hypothetical protein
MPKQESKASGGEKVFVRGPDGALYILSKDKPPYKLDAEEMKTVGQILKDAKNLVEKRLKIEAPSFGSMVNLNVPGIHILP